MAVSEERLVAVLEARLRDYEKNLERAYKTTDRQFKAIERRGKELESRLSQIGRNGRASVAGALTPALASVAAALSVNEVKRYADAWTEAKNSLAVAGVVGTRQAKVLDELYSSAQDNAVPVNALVDLYGKAAQASDSLGASSEELSRFSDGVAVALNVAGTSAAAASGSLSQLGQLLGQARVQAEEFNSINEGARPILMAVANGLDEAGGSVSKLKALVNDGKVSGQAFFQAFLRGLPSIEAMASRSTKTIEQGLTRVENAFERYIGQTDEGLGASQRLVAGLTALADNFDATADIALQLASVLAGAFVGRAIGGMLATVPRAASAVIALITAMRSGALTAVSFSAALGPLGLIAGVAAGAAVAFIKWGGAIDEATRSLAEQAVSGGSVGAMIADLERSQSAYRDAIGKTAGAQTSASNSIVADSKREFEAKRSLLELELKRQKALLAVQQADLAAKAAALKSEVSSKVYTRDDSERLGYSDPKVGNFVRLPDSMTGVDKTREVLNASPLSAEITKIRAEMELTEVGATKLEEALNSAFSADGGGKSSAGDASTGGKAKKTADAYKQMSERVAEATAALVAETDAQRSLNPLVNDYGYALAKARVAHDLLTAAEEAGKAKTPDLIAEIERKSEAYARASVAAERLSETQDKARQAAEDLRNSAKDLLGSFIDDLIEGNSLADTLANTLKNIGKQLLQVGLNNLFGGTTTGGGGGGLLGGAIIPGILHSGGTAGNDGYGHGRAVSANTFASARRYHTGGVAGLKAGEVPAILQRGEVVLPRNLSTARGSAGQTNVQVGVSVDNDGNLQAYVKGVATTTANSAVSSGLQAYDRKVLPDSIARVNRNPNRR